MLSIPIDQRRNHAGIAGDIVISDESRDFHALILEHIDLGMLTHKRRSGENRA